MGRLGGRAGRGCEAMSDAIDELLRALVAQEHAEERLAKAAYALAEAEERAEDDPDAVAAGGRRRKLYEAPGAGRARSLWGPPGPGGGSPGGPRGNPRVRLDPPEVPRPPAMLGGGGCP